MPFNDRSGAARGVVLAIVLAAVAAVHASAEVVPLPLPPPRITTAPATPATGQSDLQRRTAQYRHILEALTTDAMDGRGPGTAGIGKARDFVAAEMKGVGLRPAFGDSYLQGFEATIGVRVKEQSLAILDPKDQVLYEGKSGEGFNVLGLSPDGSFDASVVFAGYGIVAPRQGYDSYADAEDHPVKGKVVIVFRREPADEHGKSRWAKGRESWSQAASLNDKISQAQKHGAGALLIVDTPATAHELMDTRVSAFGEKAKIPVFHISREFFKQVLRGVSRQDDDIARLQQAADKEAGKLIDLGGITIRGRCRLEPVVEKLHNVAGVLPGRGDLEREAIVVGAHYDHIGVREVTGAPASAAATGAATSSAPAMRREVFAGADDNASGTAGVLTLARWLAAAAPSDEPRRTIIFVAFSGEELGLLGSEHMVRHVDDTGFSVDKIAAMINFDMIGRLRQGRLQVLGVDTGDRWRRILAAAKAPSDVLLQLGSESGGASDHASFYQRKIPVLHFFTGMHEDVHTSNDLPDRINYHGAIDVLEVAREVIESLATNPRRIAFTAAEPSSRPGRVAVAASTPSKAFMGLVLGSVGAKDKGCRVEDVNDDSPASRAGLQRGDIIKAWDKAAIGGVSDFFDKLGGAKSGQKVTLTITRDGKETTVEVTLDGQ